MMTSRAAAIAAAEAAISAGDSEEPPPVKFKKINGLLRLNPEYKAWNDRQEHLKQQQQHYAQLLAEMEQEQKRESLLRHQEQEQEAQESQSRNDLFMEEMRSVELHFATEPDDHYEASFAKFASSRELQQPSPSPPPRQQQQQQKPQPPAPQPKSPHRPRPLLTASMTESARHRMWDQRQSEHPEPPPQSRAAAQESAPAAVVATAQMEESFMNSFADSSFVSSFVSESHREGNDESYSSSMSDQMPPPYMYNAKNNTNGNKQKNQLHNNNMSTTSQFYNMSTTSMDATGRAGNTTTRNSGKGRNSIQGNNGTGGANNNNNNKPLTSLQKALRQSSDGGPGGVAPGPLGQVQEGGASRDNHNNNNNSMTSSNASREDEKKMELSTTRKNHHHPPTSKSSRDSLPPLERIPDTVEMDHDSQSLPSLVLEGGDSHHTKTGMVIATDRGAGHVSRRSSTKSRPSRRRDSAQSGSFADMDRSYATLNSKGRDSMCMHVGA